eukprot:8864092-Karenia_brevis.AAC.1
MPRNCRSLTSLIAIWFKILAQAIRPAQFPFPCLVQSLLNLHSTRLSIWDGRELACIAGGINLSTNPTHRPLSGSGK